MEERVPEYQGFESVAHDVVIVIDADGKAKEITADDPEG
jgi:hypothetical protein